MTVALPTGAALLLVLDDENLGGAADLGDSALDGSLGDVWSADRGVRTIVDKENLIERDAVTLFVGASKLLDGDDIAL